MLNKNYFMNSLLESNVIFRTLCLFANGSFSSGIAVFADCFDIIMLKNLV